jgi:phage virion morphogenesis protein
MVDGVQIQVDDQAVLATLSAAQRALANPAPIMAAIAPYLMFSTQRHIETERGPEGPWPRLSPRTANRRIGGRRRGFENMLRATNRLYSSITGDSGPDYAAVGSNLAYARIQQLGGTIDMPERHQTIYQNYDARKDRFDARFRAKRKSNFARDVKVGAHQVTVPARPYLYIDQTDRDEIERIAADVIRAEAALP